MKVAVCELPDDLQTFNEAWDHLERRLADTPVDLLVLPELAGLDSFWRLPAFDEAVWQQALDRQAQLLARLPPLAARRIAGTLAEQQGAKRWNRAFLHTTEQGLLPGRAKAWLPEEESGWEATWFDRGDPHIGVQHSEGLRLATLVCTEVMVSGAARPLGREGAQLIAVPRATGGHQRWAVALAIAAISAGAFVLSANRSGNSFAGGSSIVGPDGDLLARTSADDPVAVVAIELAEADSAKSSYPRNVIEPAGAPVTGPGPG